MSKQMPPKVISGGDNPYDIHDAKLSSSATAHESSSVTAHEISNRNNPIPFYFAEDARAEGEAIGMAKGEDRLAALVSAMVQSGADQKAILKASTDPEYRKEMYARYHIDL
ncbi:hypothetical protein ACTQ28_06005 [Bacillota bacterium LCP21S3_A4]